MQIQIIVFLTACKIVNIDIGKFCFQLKSSKCRAGEYLRIFNIKRSQVSFSGKNSLFDAFCFRIKIIHFVDDEQKTVSNLLAAFFDLFGDIVEQSGVVICT